MSPPAVSPIPQQPNPAGPSGGPGAPPSGGTPESNAQWWAGLSPQEQSSTLAAHGPQIGGMDGVPSEVRHEANIAVLRDDAANGEDKDAAQRLLDRIEGTQGGPPEDRLLLLGYEPGQGGADAQAIIAIGNPDTADNVGILVPGMGTDVGGIGADLDRMAALQAQAETIPGSGKTSTIVWLGYDAPDDVLEAISGDYARDGAADLRDFTLGLRASHQGPEAQTTVIGHSYGSTLVGTADALDGGLATNDIIAMGSPGMGYEQPDNVGFFDSNQINDVDEMNIDKNHFWAGAAGTDPVSYTEAHGNSPVDWSFDGQRITIDGAWGHSQYWDPGTEALRNQAYILTGNYDQVDTENRRVG